MKKTIITILATVLVCCCVMGGTLAWLMDSTDSIENTFTVGNVDIELTETDTSEIDGKITKSFKMVPGSEITKDATVTVKKGSEACYVFIKVVEVDPNDMLTYTLNGWTQLTDAKANIVDNVFYKSQNALIEDGADDVKLPVFTDNKINVSDTLKKSDTDQLSITLTAYAAQQSGLTVYEAWQAVSAAATNGGNS